MSKSTAYKELTEEKVQEVCKHVQEGLTSNQGCALLRVDPKSLNELMAEDSERGHRATADIAYAGAECVRLVLKECRTFGEVEEGGKIHEMKAHNARASLLKEMLRAVDPRFKVNPQGMSGGLVILIDVAGPGETSTVRIQASEGYTPPKTALPGAPDPLQLRAEPQVTHDV